MDSVIIRPSLEDCMKISSIWTAEIRDKKTGRLLQREIAKNVYTKEGAKHLLDSCLHGSTQITSWYVVPFSSNTTPTIDMSYATPVFTEYTDYAEATRPLFDEDAAATSGSIAYISNAARKADITGSGGAATIYGAALIGGGSAPSTKSDVAGNGVMLCCVKYATGLAIDASTVISMAIQVNLTL